MPDAQTRYHSTTRHSDDFYLACLLIFINGLEADQPHSTIADRLNAAGLKTTTGTEWSAAIVKSCLKRLRLHTEYRSSYHQALLRLVFAKRLTVAQVQPLFNVRTPGVQ